MSSVDARGEGSPQQQAMPTLVRVRREQPGVVGVETTVVTIQGDTLRRQKLINDKVVRESERTLDAAELERVRETLRANDVEQLAGGDRRSVQANMGRLVVEVDGTRAEAPAMMGGAPDAEGASAESGGGVHAIAEVIEGLAE